MKKTIFALLAVLCFSIPAVADDEHCYLRGDANADDQIDPSDISALIDYLLNGVWPEPTPQPEVITVNGVSFTMIPVEGGTFLMGATEEQNSSWDNEKPVHEVTLSNFSIAQTEVTQELWEAVMGNNPSSYKGNLQRPVEHVSWTDCQAFIKQLNALTGRDFRLPTEAEWEFAARGGNMSEGYKYAGSNDLNSVAWWGVFCGGTSGFSTNPVATKAPNELGIYDMSGNVSEWCQDRFGSYSSEPQTNPTGPDPETSSFCIYRGGSWIAYGQDECRIAKRFNANQNGNNEDLGLRLAL